MVQLHAPAAFHAGSAVNLRRLDLLSPEPLVQCAALGSVSAAAQRCSLPVLGASERLRRLEGTFGKPLFHRVDVVRTGAVTSPNIPPRWPGAGRRRASHRLRTAGAS